MKDFHRIHTEVRDRKNVFFSIMFIFLSAMFGIVLSLYTFIDTLTFNKAYITRDYYNSEIVYGTYAFEINKLIMIPVSLGIGLGISMLIYISEAYTKKHVKDINQQINKALQTCTFIILPLIMMMMIFSQAVYSLLYQPSNVFGPKVLLAYAPIAILLCFNHIINAVMQGINRYRFLMISMTLGVCLKFLYNEPLISRMGVDGAILATAIGILTTIVINVLKMVKTIEFKHMFIVRRFLVIFILNILVGSFLYIVNFYVLRVEVDYYNRFNCFYFLLLNAFLYIGIYLSSSYSLGLLDIITGRTFHFKTFLDGLKNKYVPNLF